MSFSKERKIPIRDTGFLSSRKYMETVPMHPIDFEAHLAWIMAKRFHELVLEKTFHETPVHYHIVG